MCEDLSGIVGAYDGEDPPVPIPNTVVKLLSADNTWLVTAREYKSVPTHKRNGVAWWLRRFFCCMIKFQTVRLRPLKNVMLNTWRLNTGRESKTDRMVALAETLYGALKSLVKSKNIPASHAAGTAHKKGGQQFKCLFLKIALRTACNRNFRRGKGDAYGFIQENLAAFHFS